MISNPPGTDRARLMMRHTSTPVGIVPSRHSVTRSGPDAQDPCELLQRQTGELYQTLQPVSKVLREELSGTVLRPDCVPP